MKTTLISRTSLPAVVQVALGARSYEILIGRGLVHQAGELIVERLKPRAAGIVCDSRVANLHLDAVCDGLAAGGLAAHRIIVPAGEGSKSWSELGRVVEALIAARLDRSDLVVALGGGVVGDLAGFAAAIVRRGLRHVQIPTTLLAQVDSSVGGKTAVNSPQGKNLIGAFHQPSLVIADTALIDTLPVRELRAGYAEVVKYGLLGDRAFFEHLEAGAWRGIFAGGPEREWAVLESCAAKAGVVARDETETGERALLNLGHTFGHALEAAVGYDPARLVHGEAVAIGMAQAFRFSVRLGLCSGQDAMRVERHLRATGLPTRLCEIAGGCGALAGLLAAIGQDKKVARGALSFILARGIGDTFVATGIEEPAVAAFLAEELAFRADQLA